MPLAIPGTYFSGGYDYAPAQTANGDPTEAGNASRSQVIDGTPARVAGLIVLSTAVLIGLRWSGFRFNVTAGN